MQNFGWYLCQKRRYAEAGSDCILTNTFGGSRIMLNRHGNADNVGPVNRAAVDIAREVGCRNYVLWLAREGTYMREAKSGMKSVA